MRDCKAVYMINDKAGKKLTKRELQVIKLISEGKTNLEIAKSLCISYYTAKAHVCSILQKLDVPDRLRAALKAVKSGLV